MGFEIDKQKEGRLLRLAVERGLLTREQVRLADEAVGEDGGGNGVADQPSPPSWCGPRFAALIAAGQLDGEEARKLVDEVISNETTLVEVPWGTGRSDPFFDRPGAPAFPPGRDRGRPSDDGMGVFLPEEDLSFLERWKRYEIVSFLGAGGMGRVYKAWDPALKRHVAVKFLRFNDPRQLERFLREARSQARVEHENICRVHEAGWVEGHPYIAMQYIDGVTLSEGAALLTLEQKVRVLHDVALAIHSAHRTGLIHRDLKPGNILLERREDGSWRPCVVDFGLAQDQEGLGLTRTGAVTGTPAYLSPEQAQSLPVDRRSDVYSLGAVLYELLGDEIPLRGSSLAESLIKVVQEAPRPLSRIDPSIPRDLDTIVMKCLEKEPRHRYDSARAFADDLERFLDDEPIAARPPSLPYRAGKWVRKNRALAGVITVALVLLLGLGGWSLWTQWRQAERAELLQRFTEQVAQVESDMRLVSLLPDQNMTRHKKRLRERMEAIRQEMERLGELGAGPGHYALGRGYLALHDYEEALEHLDLAWQGGYRRPEVAMGLGRALGVLYQKSALAGGTRPPGGEAEAGTATAERRFLGRALSYLREAEAQGPYVEAMIAFYDRHFQEALVRAQEAAEKEPWFYEARQLVAEIYIEMAVREHDRGRYDEALARYGEAGQVYAEILATARSDAFIHAAECGRGIRMLALELDLGRVPEERFLRAQEPCDQAIRIDPELADGYTHKAQLAWRHAEQLRSEGEDPEAQLEQAISYGEQAIKRNPREVLAYTHLGSAHRALARWELVHGRDPHPHLERAIESLSRAIELQPDLPEMRNNLGNVYLEKARCEEELGLDPRPSLEQGIAAYRESLRIASDFSRPWANIGNALLTRAEYEMDHGLDPKDAISESVEALRKALDLNPNQAAYHNNLGSAALTLGDLLVRDGEDPTASLSLAGRSFEKAIELNPDYNFAHANLAWAHRALAAYLVEAGQDPSRQLAAAREAITIALEKNPRDPFNHLEVGYIEHLAGRWAVRQGADPEPFFRAAEEALATGLATNDRNADLHEERASLYRTWSLWARSRGAVAGPLLARGLEAAERCLELNPERAEAMALKACLLHLAMGAEVAGSEREGHLLEVRSLLSQAIERNPRLAHTYGEILSEVGAGGGGGGR